MNQNDWISFLFGAPVGNGIVFDSLRFTEPVTFGSVFAPSGGGLYAVLTPDETARPRPYRVIYFGQAANFQQRVSPHHERYRDWVREARSVTSLYVSFHPSAAVEDR